MDKPSVKLEFTRRPQWLSYVNDSFLLIKRSSMHIMRNTDQLLATFFQPIMFLVLFTAVFGGAVGLALPGEVSYINFLMAGIVVQTLAFGSTTTAIAIANDLTRGIVDRFRSLPMSNIAVLNGHVVSDVFRNMISTVIMLLAGLLFGFSTSAGLEDWLLIALIIVLFSLAFSWISAIMGVIAKSVEGVQWLSFLIVFPLTFASSAFVPAESMVAWLRVFAENQPITHIIEALRALLIQDAENFPLDDHAWIAIAWCVATILVCMPISAWLFRKKTS